MTSPIPPAHSAEHDASVQRLMTPTTRILTAAIILFTGAGIAAIFWKMPTSAEFYDLCRAEVVDKDLAAVPLPHESVASISREEMQQMVLPTLGVSPSMDSGAVKYAQVYEPPASLAAMGAPQAVEQEESPVLIESESSASPQKFEPMRHIVEKKPIILEPVDAGFVTKPESVSTTEKSDEMLSKFHFAENGKAEFDQLTPPVPPTDPFPMPVPDATVPVSAVSLSSALPIASPLQPLLPLAAEGLSPLQPL